MKEENIMELLDQDNFAIKNEDKKNDEEEEVFY